MNTRSRCRSGRSRRSDDDRGSAEPLFVLPIVFAMVLAVAQAGVWAHAQHRTQAIASQALASARAFDGSAEAARERAEQAREHLGGGVLHRVEVEVDRTTDLARVRVAARTVGLVPGTGLPVSAEMSGPVERLAP